MSTQAAVGPARVPSADRARGHGGAPADQGCFFGRVPPKSAPSLEKFLLLKREYLRSVQGPVAEAATRQGLRSCLFDLVAQRDFFKFATYKLGQSQAPSQDEVAAVAQEWLQLPVARAETMILDKWRVVPLPLARAEDGAPAAALSGNVEEHADQRDQKDVSQEVLPRAPQVGPDLIEPPSEEAAREAPSRSQDQGSRQGSRSKAKPKAKPLKGRGRGSNRGGGGSKKESQAKPSKGRGRGSYQGREAQGAEAKALPRPVAKKGKDLSTPTGPPATAANSSKVSNKGQHAKRKEGDLGKSDQPDLAEPVIQDNFDMASDTDVEALDECEESGGLAAPVILENSDAASDAEVEDLEEQEEPSGLAAPVIQDNSDMFSDTEVEELEEPEESGRPQTARPEADATEASRDDYEAIVEDGIDGNWLI